MTEFVDAFELGLPSWSEFVAPAAAEISTPKIDVPSIEFEGYAIEL